ncbi:MAG: carbohydrate ABC transporter permease [Anaerolineales bacterium]|nr:carbohydrate ABC transporter permease [Anaerolineales bacterium]
MSNINTKGFWRTLVYVLLLMAALFYLLPMYMVVITSLKDPAEISLSKAWDLPKGLHWESFTEAWDKFDDGLFNSLKLVVAATVLSAVMGSMNGYILAKWKVPWSGVLFPMVLFGMFIPYQAILIPLFDFMRQINLFNDLKGLILIHVVYGLPITTLIFRNFYVNIPDEVLESASIDGANFFGIYWHIVLRLSAPAFVVVVIWQFTQIWNEFLFAVTITQRPDRQPITAGLAQLAGGQAVDWNLPMAGAIMAALPTLLVYIIAGRYFISGLLAGSVKG